MDYSEKLLDVRWQRKRLEKLSAAGWQCEKCCAHTKTLHVHHVRYRHGAEPWEYSSDELEALCGACHREEHHISQAADSDLVNGSSPFYALFCWTPNKRKRRLVKNFAHLEDAHAAVAARAKRGIAAEYIVVGQA
jgi:hypothetical protein